MQKVWRVTSPQGIFYFETEQAAIRGAVNIIFKTIKSCYNPKDDCHIDLHQMNWLLKKAEGDSAKTGEHGCFDYYSEYRKIIDLWNVPYWREISMGQIYPKIERVWGKISIEQVEIFEPFPPRPEVIPEDFFEIKQKDW